MTACTKEKIYKIQEISLKRLVLIPGTENLVHFLSIFFLSLHITTQSPAITADLTIFTHFKANTCKKIIHVRLILLFFKLATKLMYYCIHLPWRYKHNGRFQDIIYLLSPTKTTYLSEMKPDFAHISWS